MLYKPHSFAKSDSLRRHSPCPITSVIRFFTPSLTIVFMYTLGTATGLEASVPYCLVRGPAKWCTGTVYS